MTQQELVLPKKQYYDLLKYCEMQYLAAKLIDDNKPEAGFHVFLSVRQMVFIELGED